MELHGCRLLPVDLKTLAACMGQLLGFPGCGRKVSHSWIVSLGQRAAPIRSWTSCSASTTSAGKVNCRCSPRADPPPFPAPRLTGSTHQARNQYSSPRARSWRLGPRRCRGMLDHPENAGRQIVVLAPFRTLLPDPPQAPVQVLKTPIPPGYWGLDVRPARSGHLGDRHGYDLVGSRDERAEIQGPRLLHGATAYRPPRRDGPGFGHLRRRPWTGCR